MKQSQEIALKKIIKMNGWTKRGGYANAKEKLFKNLLLAAGFKRSKSINRPSSPSCFSEGSDNYIHPLGITAKWWERFGSHKDENSFSITIKIVEGSK